MIIAHLAPKDSAEADKELKDLLNRKIIRGTIYFAGAGFPQTVNRQISGGSLSILPFIKRLVPGSIISLEKCIFPADDGKTRMTVSKTFRLE